MISPTADHRWHRPAPAWLVLGSLVATGGLWLSNWLGWPAWHKGYAVLAAVAGVGVVLILLFLWYLAALLFRLRFQFSIRLLLVLTVAVALPFSWLGVEMKKTGTQREAVEETLKEAGFIDYDYQENAPPGGAKPKGPTWLRLRLGDDFFNDVISARVETDAQMERLRELPRLQSLSLSGTSITDAGLARIAGLTQLRALWLHQTRITDEGLAHIACAHSASRLGARQHANHGCRVDATCRVDTTSSVVAHRDPDYRCRLAHVSGLTQLRHLMLADTRITDAGLVHVSRLTQLYSLDLENTQISDTGLAHLTGLSQLLVLQLLNTRTTGAAVEKLQQALPNCKIDWLPPPDAAKQPK